MYRCPSLQESHPGGIGTTNRELARGFDGDENNACIGVPLFEGLQVVLS